MNGVHRASAGDHRIEERSVTSTFGSDDEFHLHAGNSSETPPSISKADMLANIACPLVGWGGAQVAQLVAGAASTSGTLGGSRLVAAKAERRQRTWEKNVLLPPPKDAATALLAAEKPIALHKRLGKSKTQELDADWSKAKVKQALKDMAVGKSLGVDGIPKEFFSYHWDELGGDLMNFVKSFEKSAVLSASAQEAATILLQKKGARD
ncbi:unnamed protein product [Closterium sp. NIES-54]